MDAASALADLTEISSQVEAAVVVGAAGAVLASTLASDAAAERLARAGAELLDAAGSSFGGGDRAVTRLEVALREGSVFAVREEGLVLVARTGPCPSSGLVLYDLRTCLRALTAAPPAPKRRPARKKKQETAGA